MVVITSLIIFFSNRENNRARFILEKKIAVNWIELFAMCSMRSVVMIGDSHIIYHSYVSITKRTMATESCWSFWNGLRVIVSSIRILSRHFDRCRFNLQLGLPFIFRQRRRAQFLRVRRKFSSNLRDQFVFPEMLFQGWVRRVHSILFGRVGTVSSSACRALEIYYFYPIRWKIKQKKLNRIRVESANGTVQVMNGNV